MKLFRKFKLRFLDEFYGRMHRYHRGTYHPFQFFLFRRKDSFRKNVSHFQVLMDDQPALAKLQQNDIFFIDHVNCRVVISTELLKIFNESYRIYHNDNTAINWFNIFREQIVIQRACAGLPVISDISTRPLPFLVVDTVVGGVVYSGIQDEQGLDYEVVQT